MKSDYTAQARYDILHSKSISLKFNRKTDSDIINWLLHQRSVQGSIKRLIREEIARTEQSEQ